MLVGIDRVETRSSDEPANDDSNRVPVALFHPHERVDLAAAITTLAFTLGIVATRLASVIRAQSTFPCIRLGYARVVLL